jgi:ABC-type nickel/cobalt efflux system permease component RcnA
MKRLLALLALAFTGSLALFAPASPAAAHPLGNFSVNTAAAIQLYADAVQLTYVVDMAEIPTLQESAAIDSDGNGTFESSELDAYLAARAPMLIANLELTADGRPIVLSAVSGVITLPPGQAGLATLRIELNLTAPAGGSQLTPFVFADSNFEGRAGYHEVTVAAAPGVTLAASSAPALSPTSLLTVYNDSISASGGTRRATFTYTPGAGTLALEGTAAVALAAPVAARASGPLARFLQADTITLTTIGLMLAIALAFGAVHALEPGHGKSIVAAYFIGTRGSAAQAALLGLMVAVTHSLGVFAIATLVLFGSRFILPETLYPWLTLASGLMVFGLGGLLLVARLRASEFWHRALHRRQHPHDHTHVHTHEHTHEHTGDAPRRPPWKALVVLGLVDGMVPTPSTLVVLLGAISLDRIELGLLLVVAFSTGMALVMAGISLAVLVANAAGRRLRHRLGGSRARVLVRMAPAFPAVAAFVLLVVGSSIVVRGLSQVASL